MAATDADLQSAMTKLAANFSDAELEAVTVYLGNNDDEVAGFAWDPAQDHGMATGLLQRIESHPGFKLARSGFVATDDLARGIVRRDLG